MIIKQYFECMDNLMTKYVKSICYVNYAMKLKLYNLNYLIDCKKKRKENRVLHFYEIINFSKLIIIQFS